MTDRKELPEGEPGESTTLDGTFCRPWGGSDPTGPPSEGKAYRFDSAYNTVWLTRREGRTTDGKGFIVYREGDASPTPVTRELAENVLGAHKPEETATMPVAYSPFAEFDTSE